MWETGLHILFLRLDMCVVLAEVGITIMTLLVSIDLRFKGQSRGL